MSDRYEIHVTVTGADPIKFTEECTRRGWKAVFIENEMADGSTVKETMTSIRFSGLLVEALVFSQSISRTLANNGFKVARIKVEAEPQSGYFETHIEVSEKDLVAVSRNCAKPGIKILTIRGLTEPKVTKERVLFDSNPKHDAAWINGK